VGASKTGTMTQNWGDPTSGIRGDTLRVVGITTNQPGKRWVADDGKLINLNFFILGDVGNTTVVRINDIKLFGKNGAITLGSVSEGQMTVVENPASSTINLTLYPGINFVSFPVTPDPNKLPDALGAVPVNYIWGYFSGYPKSWQAGRPGNPLQAIDGLHGYWVRLNDSVNNTLTLTGPPTAVNTPMPMIRGLNLISYLPNVQDALTHAFATLDTNYSYVWNYSAATGSPRSWLRNRPGNPLTTLTPLLAYWVRMSNFGTLVYPSSGYILPKASGNTTGGGPSDYSGITATTEWCDFWALQPGTLQPGDTIRAYDRDGILCGDTLVAPDGSFVLPVAGDDPITVEDEGALPGEEVHFTLNGRNVDVVGASANYDTIVVLGAKAVWENMGSKRVQFEDIHDGIGSILDQSLHPQQIKLFRNHPNPFNPRTELEYELPEAGSVHLDVFDIRGRWIRGLVSGYQQPGPHSVIWDGRDEQENTVPSGIYYFVFKFQQQVRIQKGVFIK
jgi:hypothetical protein